MKVDVKTLAEMRKAISIVLPLIHNVSTIDWNDEFTRHNLWFQAWANKTYPDNNPNVIKDSNGERLLPYCDRADFELYPCNTNDTTIDTALRAIMKELQTSLITEPCIQ